MNISRTVLAVAALGVLLGAGRLIVPEYSEVIRPSGNPAGAYLIALQGPQDFASVGALRSQLGQLAWCDELQISGYDRLVGEVATQNVAESCLVLAETVLRSSPTHSTALLVRAGAMRLQGKPQNSLQDLKLAQVTAPNEGWLAARRLKLTFALVNVDQAEFDAVALQDVDVLAKDLRYRDILAELYVANPDRREWFISALEGQPDAAVRRFLGQVKKRMEAGA